MLTAPRSVGVMTIIAQISPIEKQTAYTNGVGMVYSLGAVSGPLIGGAFTSHVRSHRFKIPSEGKKKLKTGLPGHVALG